ncbi:hypothetical protein LHP98_12875 [Rhodobacter sp. Har01]|uniref:hypothetical protein n=1 Tax=Rhodobacter sp. Har01 TaxID=2883999 RepID=UPI001D072C9A|nr:hypothetical protein [Rhodobacter sp. Har01]MCB6179018.1 hypothetical protein [Rhodobacter sp. Har01]
MSERKVGGHDVNGWRDFTARNWSSLPGEDEQIGEVVFSESGPLTSVVKVGEGRSSRWVGGRQADVAPHGNGGGWGDVGFEGRRVDIRTLLEGQGTYPAELSAAFEGAAKGAVWNAIAIDDTPETTELVRERILAAAGEARLRNPMLVWRSVLAALSAIEAGLVTKEGPVAVISQTARGLSVQTLRLRRACGRSGEILAPERRRAADLVPGAIGYGPLVRKAREIAIGPEGFSARTAHFARARSVGRLALGLPCPTEVLRQPTGDWDFIDLGRETVLPKIALDTPMPRFGDCSAIFVETLSDGPVRDALLALVAREVGRDPVSLPQTAVAHGALVAARRRSDGDPVYFDFLPRLSTIVFGRNGASNFDLIDETETLEAGHVYRSREPAEFQIPAGHASVSVFLRKEAEPRPRKATVTLDVPLKSPSPVSLWVEQKPAAGRARIVLDAPALGRHFTIDWEQAEDDPRDWDAIIGSVMDKAPSIPERLVLKTGLAPWQDGERADGLFTLLEKESRKATVDWDTLAMRMASRPFGEYCISSDGDLPDQIDAVDIERLDALTRRALETTQARLCARPGPSNSDNAALKFLTWQFRRCPPVVADWLIDCIESRGMPMFRHPFVQRDPSWILVYQGLGRITGDETTERRILRILLDTEVRDWNWRHESATIAFLLSRSNTAPLALDRKDVTKLVQRIVIEFKRNLRTSYTTFNYSPFLVAGVLRWRLAEPRGLLLGHDPLADDLLKVIEDAEHDLTTQPLPSDARAREAFSKKKIKYLPILKDLKAELAGEGGNPDLLLRIYGNGE